MKVGELILKFLERTSVPVDVNEVIEELRVSGIKDEIWFFEIAGLDTEVLRGEIKHWSYGIDKGDRCEVTYVADISFASTQALDWQRLVSCKELLHLLDAPDHRVATPEDVERLIEKIVLPPDLQDPIRDGMHATTDRTMRIIALAVLFPVAAVRALKKPFDDGKITLERIANLVELPPPYVALAMSDEWEEIHDILIQL